MIRAVGVETGGSNVQFAVNPRDRRDRRDRDEPARLARSARSPRRRPASRSPRSPPGSRSATRCEEIPNDITRATPASFEPTIDYCVVKWPRFAFEKFPGADGALTTHMKSVGEAMAIGRTSARRSPRRCARASSTPAAELDRRSTSCCDALGAARRRRATTTCSRRCAAGRPSRQLHARTPDRPLVPARARRVLRGRSGARRSRGRADVQVGRHLRGGVRRPDAVLLLRLGAAGPRRRADPRGRARRRRPSVVILGSGPNRIGQGIEFDYCCVHAAQTVRESGRDAVMINCNPETVSTDYDTSDRLYFEPLTLEDVLGVCELEQPEGVIVQFGGQTPLKLAAGLRRRRGPDPRHEHRRDRPRRGPRPLRRAARPRSATRRRRTRRRTRAEEALERAPAVGFPLLVRPSYVLGGRAMEIVYASTGLADYLRGVGADAAEASRRSTSTASSRTRSRSTSTPSATARTSGSAGSCSTSRRPGSTPATRPACCRRTRSATTCSTEIREQTTGHRARRSASSACSTSSSRDPRRRHGST